MIINSILEFYFMLNIPENYKVCLETSSKKDCYGRERRIGRIFHLFPEKDGTGRAFQTYEHSVAEYLIRNLSRNDTSISFTKQRIHKFQSPLKGKVFYHAEFDPETGLFEGSWKGKTDTRAKREGKFFASTDTDYSKANLGKILLDIESHNLSGNLSRLKDLFPYLKFF